MNFAEAGFWFFLGFFVASWLAHRSRLRNQAKSIRDFLAAKSEILRLLDSVKELAEAEIQVTIRDETGSLDVETVQKPKRKPRDGMH